MVNEQTVTEWLSKPKKREEEIHDPRKADLDINGNIIIQSANPGMIRQNKRNDYTVIPIFI